MEYYEFSSHSKQFLKLKLYFYDEISSHLHDTFWIIMIENLDLLILRGLVHFTTDEIYQKKYFELV